MIISCCYPPLPPFQCFKYLFFRTYVYGNRRYGYYQPDGYGDQYPGQYKPEQFPGNTGLGDDRFKFDPVSEFFS